MQNFITHPGLYGDRVRTGTKRKTVPESCQDVGTVFVFAEGQWRKDESSALTGLDPSVASSPMAGRRAVFI